MKKNKLFNLLQAGAKRAKRAMQEEQILTYRGIRIIEKKELPKGTIRFLSNDAMKHLDKVISAGTNV